MKNIIRAPETHPLTWRLRDDQQPVWLDEYCSKNGYQGRVKRSVSYRRTRSSAR